MTLSLSLPLTLYTGCRIDFPSVNINSSFVGGGGLDCKGAESLASHVDPDRLAMSAVPGKQNKG